MNHIITLLCALLAGIWITGPCVSSIDTLRGWRVSSDILWWDSTSVASSGGILSQRRVGQGEWGVRGDVIWQLIIGSKLFSCKFYQPWRFRSSDMWRCCQWKFSFLNFRVSKSLHRLGQTLEGFIFDCLTLKMKTLHCSEMSVSMYQWTRCTVPED